MGGLDNDLPYNTRQRYLVAVTAFCITIATIAVALRLIARRQFHVNLWWDDYVAVIALVGVASTLASPLFIRLTVMIRSSRISQVYSPSWVSEQGSGDMRPISPNNKLATLASSVY